MKKQLFRLLCAISAAIACTVSAWAVPDMLIPGGCTVGIKLHTKGLMVTGFEEASPAEQAGLKKGDIILEVDGKAIQTADSLREQIQKDDLMLTVLRNGKKANFLVTPEEKQIGAHVRDTVAGIGTVTYYDPISGDFGALGHGVNDVNSSQLIPVDEGVLIRSSVAQIVRGKHGTPGELKGQFDLKSVMGTVERNCPFGIFGTMSVPLSKKPLPVASAEEVKEGRATILSNISGEETKAYSVEIQKIYPDARDTGRNLLLKVTDKDLLAATGGIVQGMSGSPIIQNGKLIGAVTHVLVNDPTKGYGIFIENMLEAAS